MRTVRSPRSAGRSGVTSCCAESGDHRVAERREGLEPREKSVEALLVRLVRGQHEPAALRLGADDPAVDELFVDGEVRRDHADDLRHVGGDQLFTELVGAIEERRARQHGLDRTAAGDPRDADAIAARERRAATLEHAARCFRRCREARRSAGAGWR